MTNREGRHDPPGRPLWLAAEAARIDKFGGEDKYDFVLKRLGIGRVTYDRLVTQENRPITRTVKKIAEGIGMPLREAMALAGYADQDGADAVIVSSVLTGAIDIDRIRRILAASGNPPSAEFVQSLGRLNRQLDELRDAAAKSGKTLGDVLVETGLAQREELKVTIDGVVGEIENDDLPDDVKRELLDGYRQLRKQVAETAQRRRKSG